MPRIFGYVLRKELKDKESEKPPQDFHDMSYKELSPIFELKNCRVITKEEAGEQVLSLVAKYPKWTNGILVAARSYECITANQARNALGLPNRDIPETENCPSSALPQRPNSTGHSGLSGSLGFASGYGSLDAEGPSDYGNQRASIPAQPRRV